MKIPKKYETVNREAFVSGVRSAILTVAGVRIRTVLKFVELGMIDHAKQELDELLSIIDDSEKQEVCDE
jgi:hypothetical protein